MTEKFILVSLDDEKSKKIANIVSNDTCRKILDYLGEKDASETDIAKSLSMPLSTVHYNIQNLHSLGLVEIKDFIWSDKGNKINVYKVAKKFIVIAPKGEQIGSSLRNLLPAAIISIGAAAIVYVFSGFQKAAPAILPEEAARSAEVMMKDVALSQASGVAEIAAENTSTVLSTTIMQANNVFAANYSWLWFLAGSIFAIFIYFALSKVRRKK